MKTQKQIQKILTSLIPDYYLDIKTEKNKSTYSNKEIFEISAICEIEKQTAKEFNKEPKRTPWFYFWKSKDGWHISLDGAHGYDYLSYSAEFGPDSQMLGKLKELTGVDYLDWDNHYSFNIA